MLFSWYYKGFELVCLYLVKHPLGMNLENLDMEVVDQEMTTDEASQPTSPKAAPGDTSMPPPHGDDAVVA